MLDRVPVSIGSLCVEIANPISALIECHDISCFQLTANSCFESFFADNQRVTSIVQRQACSP